MQIQRVFTNLGIKSYPEDSGFKGMHLWVFLAKPQPARDVLLLAKKVLAKVGAPPTGLHREIFPKESRVAPKALGSMIKLPLGIHKVTGKRCLFLDSTGQPLPDQLAQVRNIVTTTDNTFKTALEKLKLSPETQFQQQPRADRTQVDKVFKKCNVLAYLKQKAEQERTLSHTERLTVLGILGHLGKAGGQTIHEIMGNTLNYSFRITERWVQRLKGFPISCPKIRERHSYITPSVGCFCKFPEIKNSYPAPVRHADPEIIVKIKNKEKKAEPPKPATNQVPPEQKEEKPTMPPPPTTQIQSETTVKPTKILPGKTPEKATPRDVNSLLQKYMTFKKEQRQINHKIVEIEQQLNQLCEQQGMDVFETEFGVFKRTKAGKWVIEI